MAMRQAMLHGPTLHRSGQRCLMQACRAFSATGTSNLLVCNVYVSEGKDDGLISRLQAVAKVQPAVLLAHTFVDCQYNRTGFTLTAWDPSKLSDAAVQLSSAALGHLDLTRHTATHPRVGAVDHISVHPIPIQSPASNQDEAEGVQGPGLTAAVEVVHRIATQLSRPPWALPCYLYGAAHPEGRRLAAIRSQLGYFKTSAPQPSSPQQPTSTWSGPSVRGHPPIAPDLGPHLISDRWGVLTIGARPWVTNFNIPLHEATTQAGSTTGTHQHDTPSPELMRKGRLIARAVSERGGGLPGVEAMALPHDGGRVEVACNLLNASLVPPQRVQTVVEQLAASEGLTCGAGYLTCLTPDQLVQVATQALGSPPRT